MAPDLVVTTMDDDLLSDTHREELLSACRTTVGDEIRSVTYFTDGGVQQLYLRSDLDQTADLVGFAEHERRGFHTQGAYRNTQLGEYEATVRMFEYGYLTRVLSEDDGVWVTADSMSMERFEELAAALKPILAEIPVEG